MQRIPYIPTELPFCIPPLVVGFQPWRFREEQLDCSFYILPCLHPFFFELTATYSTSGLLCTTLLQCIVESYCTSLLLSPVFRSATPDALTSPSLFHPPLPSSIKRCVCGGRKGGRGNEYPFHAFRMRTRAKSEQKRRRRRRISISVMLSSNLFSSLYGERPLHNEGLFLLSLSLRVPFHSLSMLEAKMI